MQVLSWLYVIVAVMLLFGAAIFVHEFGHFWMARRRGLKVGSFSIGFGPKILGWTRNGIDYEWRGIPAGGYVTLPQMVSSPARDNRPQGTVQLPPVSPGSKMLVAVAGPVMNVLFALVIATAIYFLGLPIRVDPAIIGQEPPGSPEARLGIRAGDRIVAVNGQPVDSWQAVEMATALARTDVLPVTIARHGVQTTYHLTAAFDKQRGLKLLNLYPEEPPVIARVLRGSAAEKAGLQRGDEIVACAGVPVVGPEQLIGLIQKRPGEPTSIEVKRGPQRLTCTVTPELNPSTQLGVLGVIITPNTTTIYRVRKPGPLPWRLVGQVCRQTFGMMAALVHWRQTGVGVQDLSGPPGILAMLAVDVKTDYRLALKFMVLLNISLAILNLVPAPVLDGGYIAVALIEKLRGRPVSARLQQSAATVFAGLLISLMLYVSYNDVVKRFPLFKSMLNQPVRFESDARAATAPVPATK
jgi:regulator of sigma E protease